MKFRVVYPTLKPTAVAPFVRPCIGVPSIAVLVPEMYSWKVSLALSGEVQMGLGLMTGSIADVLDEVVDEVDTTEVEAELTGVVDLVVNVAAFVLDLMVVGRETDLGFVDVDVEAGRVDVEVAREPSSTGIVAEDPSSPAVVVAADPSSPEGVVGAELSSPDGVVAAEPSSPPLPPSDPDPAPESSPPVFAPEPSSVLEPDVGFALRVEDEDFLVEMPFLPVAVPVIEDNNFEPPFEPDLEADTAEETLLPDFEAEAVFVRLLRVELFVVDVLDDVFAVSLLQAIPTHRRVDELETEELFDDSLTEVEDSFPVEVFLVEMPGVVLMETLGVVLIDGAVTLVVVCNVVFAVVFGEVLAVVLGTGFAAAFAVVFATRTTGSCKASFISFEASEIHLHADVSSEDAMP